MQNFFFLYLLAISLYVFFKEVSVFSPIFDGVFFLFFVVIKFYKCSMYLKY